MNVVYDVFLNPLVTLLIVLLLLWSAWRWYRGRNA